jgi:hypothetical protein
MGKRGLTHSPLRYPQNVCYICTEDGSLTIDLIIASHMPSRGRKHNIRPSIKITLKNTPAMNENLYRDNPHREARSGVHPKHDASQTPIALATPSPGRCKNRHLWVYYRHSHRKPIQKMENHACLGNHAITPLQQRREAPAVARGRSARLRLKKQASILFHFGCKGWQGDGVLG